MKNKVFDYKEKPFKELLKGKTLWDYQIKKKNSILLLKFNLQISFNYKHLSIDSLT